MRYLRHNTRFIRHDKGFTNKDVILRELDISEEKPAHLLTLRWQAVGFVVTIITAFWVILFSNFFTKRLEIDIIYLSIFSGILFSIIILLFWRYITHILMHEEFCYYDNMFIMKELLKDSNLSRYTDEFVKDRWREIKHHELKVYQIETFFGNEFDNDSKVSELSKKFSDKFYSLNSVKRDILFKTIYCKKFLFKSKEFEKGLVKFDWFIGFIIIFLYFVGVYVLILMNNLSKTRHIIFKILRQGFWFDCFNWFNLIIIIYILILLGICWYFYAYLYQIRWGSEEERLKKFKNIIEGIREENSSSVVQ